LSELATWEVVQQQSTVVAAVAAVVVAAVAVVVVAVVVAAVVAAVVAVVVAVAVAVVLSFTSVSPSRCTAFARCACVAWGSGRTISYVLLVD
jgi:hypothetical protein